MEEDLEDENLDCNLQAQTSDDALEKKTRPPNKKKFDEEMLTLNNQIKEKETELDRLKSSGALHISKDLNSLRAEKSAKITRRKEIDDQLARNNNKILPEKRKNLTQLDLSLSLRSEDRINAAIQRLEWNLKAHSYKLSEEKRIVSEIDSLKRSKKILGQYLTLKQEINVIQDQQRHMREERDFLYRSVSQIKAKEEAMKATASSTKSSIHQLKKAIDALYETRRNILAGFKRQKDEYNEVKERQKLEGLRRKESFLQDKRKRIAEKEAAKVPFEEEIHLCNTLISYLGRFNTLPVNESSVDSQDDPEYAEEIDDGQYVLLKKSGADEGSEQPANSRKLSRRNRRSRKQSMIKQITHTPETLNQFLTLSLVAPATTADVGATLDQLLVLKGQYEQDQSMSSHLSEVASDAGVSATESLICEMSRQVSKTESSEEGLGAGGSGECGSSTEGDDQVACADLLAYKGTEDSPCDSKSDVPVPEAEERGAVGGSIVAEAWGSQDGTGQNSDSTVEGDSGSIESQASVCDANQQSGCLEGAVGGEPSVDSKPARPVPLYSEMLNMHRSDAGQQRTATIPSVPPGMPKHHPPLSSSTSSPANVFSATSPQRVVSHPTGPTSQSLDSGISRPSGQKVRETESHSNRLNVHGKEFSAIHRRSTFSGRGRQLPRGQENSKTAIERRETFSGHRKERNFAQGRQPPSVQVQKGSSVPWKQPEALTGREGALPNRPKAFTQNLGPVSSLPPLSASWSGIASGSIRSAAHGLGQAPSYSAVVSPQVSQSPSFPIPQGFHTGEVLSPQGQVSPSGRGHRAVSSRTSAPSFPEAPAQQKVQLAARASLPQTSSSSLSPGQQTGNPQMALLSPPGLTDGNHDFPPLSLSASMSAPPRRNSSNSSFSARSGNSASATGNPHEQQPFSLDKQVAMLSLQPQSKSSQSHPASTTTNGSSGPSHTKTVPLGLGNNQVDTQSCDTLASTLATSGVTGVKEVALPPSSSPPSQEECSGHQTCSSCGGLPGSASELVGVGAELLPTDNSFTARWVADLSPPITMNSSVQAEASSEWGESTHL